MRTLHIIVIALSSIIFLSSCNLIEPRAETVSLNVFFASERDNQNFNDCENTDFVTRVVPKSIDATVLAKSALAELFKGPSLEEKAQGLKEFWITTATSSNLKSIKIIDGTAYVDWKPLSQIIPNASTSCGSSSFLTPLEDTLFDIEGIDNVVQAIDGKPKAFYEWLQLSCPDFSNNCDETPFK